VVRTFYAAQVNVVLPFKIVDKILRSFMYFDHSPVILFIVLHKVVLTLIFLSGDKQLKPPFNESY